MSACIECGLPESAWPHRVNHPAVTTRPEAHLFVREVPLLVVPTSRKNRKRIPKHRDFVIGDIAIWRYPHATTQPPLRVRIVGFDRSGAGTKLYEFMNQEDEWDVNRYAARWEDLTLVRWELGRSDG